MNTKYIYSLSLLACAAMPAFAQNDLTEVVDLQEQQVEVGASRTFSRQESAAAVSVITTTDVNKRGGRNIGNSIIGQGSGLISLQGAGLYEVANPTFYVRGMQTFSEATPLILVDGIERSIDNVIAEDVESVQILKDAAATALYGYKGVNGAILIKTKHGQNDSKKIAFTYDHGFQMLSNKPEFVDASTYAKAVNEAYRNQGSKAIYNDAALAAYASGNPSAEYPNVNWVDETFRNVAHVNRYNLEFSGGSKVIRYYTNVNLLASNGFVKNDKPADADYSTQNKYSRASIRSNMDVELTPTTQLHTHINGILTEQLMPGSQADLWSMVYKVPANAFDVQVAPGVWGGNTVYTTQNPVAQSMGAAYYKKHQRALLADFVIDQDLSSVTPGLAASAQLGYDTWSNVFEDHSRTFRYGYLTDGNLVTDGSESKMGTGSGNDAWTRRFFMNANLHYDRSFGKSDVYAQLMYDYEFSDVTGVNTSVCRQNISLMGSYSFDKRYNAQVYLVESGSSRLAPGTKWAFAPTAALGWNASNEEFLKDSEVVKFLKLRTSFGIQQRDVLPGDNVWTYYDSFYNFGSPTYSFDSTGNGTEFGNTYIAQAKTQNPSREKAKKFNVGVDATLFEGWNISADYYAQRRYDIWVNTEGAYTSVFGLTAPYENLGEMKSYGVEVSTDYTKQMGDWTFNVGGNFSFNHNSIIEMAEAPQLFDNTRKTGHRYGQIMGYKADGFFQKSDDLDNNGVISVDEMISKGYAPQTFTTVYPGDVKYQDVNGDKKIDSNDVTAIGYSNLCPEVFYSLHLGAEWKGLGLDMMFQGVGNYSGTLTTAGMYRSAVASNTLSQYLYDNCWSSERGNTENPKFPRLSATSNTNNDVVSTLCLLDRSYFKLRNIELYYRLPAEWLSPTRFVKAAKVYVKGNDLFTIDHLDNGDAAAYGATQPLTRNVMIGASLTF